MSNFTLGRTYVGVNIKTINWETPTLEEKVEIRIDRRYLSQNTDDHVIRFTYKNWVRGSHPSKRFKTEQEVCFPKIKANFEYFYYDGYFFSSKYEKVAQEEVVTKQHTFIPGQIIKHSGQIYTLIGRINVPTEKKIVPYWVYLKGPSTDPSLIAESDLLEMVSELIAA